MHSNQKKPAKIRFFFDIHKFFCYFCMFCPKISRKGIKKPPPFDSVGEGTSLVIGDWSLVIGLTTAPLAPCGSLAFMLGVVLLAANLPRLHTPRTCTKTAF